MTTTTTTKKSDAKKAVAKPAPQPISPDAPENSPRARLKIPSARK